MNNIYLLWPTVRPTLFKTVVAEWLNNSEHPKHVKIKVAVNTELDKQELKNYDVIVTGNQRPGCTYPSYCLAKTLKDEAKDDDIIILASDDFFPPDDWDDFLREQLKNQCKGLVVNDSIQLINKVVTLPIMTFSCLKKLNYIIYHPAYCHQYSDEELYHNLNDLGLLKDIRQSHIDTVFEHKHYVNRRRTLDRADQQTNSFAKQDQQVFASRMQMPVQKRLEVGQIL